MANLWESLFSGGTNALGYNELLGRLDQDKGDLGNNIDAIQQQVTDTSTFQPWSATSSIGTSGMDATGNTNYNLSGQQQSLQDMLSGYAQNMYGQSQTMDPRFAGQGSQFMGAGQDFMNRSMQPTAGREQDIYARMRAMQRPDEMRAQESMQAGLFGTGRGGMATDAYGGSSEEFAYNKARQEAMNTASYQAMQQAQQEQMNQGNLAGQYGQLGQNALTAGGQLQNMYSGMGNQQQLGSYLPMEMLLKQQMQGLGGSEMYGQSGQNLAQMLADLGLGEIGTKLNYGNLETDAFSNMINAAGSLAGGVGGAIDDGGGLLATLRNLL